MYGFNMIFFLDDPPSHFSNVSVLSHPRQNQGSGKLLRLLRILVDKSKSRGQFWSETTRKASGQIVSGQ